MLAFGILGPLEVVDQERRVVLGGPKQRALLAILLLRRGEAVSSDRLIDQLWGERPPATAAKTSAGVCVASAQGAGRRRALHARRWLPARGRRRVRSTPTVSRRSPPTHVARSPTVTLLARSELLDVALGLWRGEPLADLAYEPFAQGEIARLEEARLAALEDRIEADLMLGHDRDLVGELEGLVARASPP